MKTCDVLIAGGGLVGLVLACALGERGLEVRLVEKSGPSPPKDWQGADLRVSSIHLGAQRALMNLGAWGDCSKAAAQPFSRVEVWEEGSWARALFDALQIGEPCLGCIVENRALRYDLWQRLEGMENVELMVPQELSSISPDGRGWKLSFDRGAELRPRLLVGAEGQRSQVRSWAGLDGHSESYPQRALVACIRRPIDAADSAWQCFTPEGALAYLPLTANRASLVCYRPPATVEALKALDDDALAAELKALYPTELGEIEALEGRASFSLQRHHARSYWRPGLALIGDAAHGVHPLAGQGLNMGIRDALLLAEEVCEARESGSEIGAAAVLRRYEKRARWHNRLMAAALHSTYASFSLTPPWLKRVRFLALAASNLPGSQRLLMRFASGLDAYAPEKMKAAV